MVNRDPVVAALILVERNYRQARRRFQVAMKRISGQFASDALEALQVIPGPPVYPIRWKSVRQRRAFFATKGFGRGIPARRGSPPSVTQAWSAEFVNTRSGGILVLSNSAPHMRYVQGEDAQPFHLDTGWVQVDDVIDDFFREAESSAVQTFFDVCDPLEGV